jgi:protein SCO1/2
LYENNTLAVLLGSILLGIMLLTGCADSGAASGAASSPPPTPAYQPPTEGTPIEPPREVQDFTLINQDGQPVSLSDLRGKPVVLYFGYTFCPDICPTTLADITRARYNLGEYADDVHFVMVSVDPERDTPEVMKAYLANFNENFIGLQGDPEVLRQIAPDYGLFYQKREIEGTSAAYLIDHSAATYLIDEQGRLIMIYGYGIPAEVISNDLRQYLETGSLS